MSQPAEQNTQRHQSIIHYSEVTDPDDAHYPNSEELLSIGSPVGKALGLKKIGVHIERVPQGRRTSFPHAESEEEEFVYVIEGTPLVWLDGEVYQLGPGDVVGFPAGTGLAHTFINDSAEDALLLVAGESRKNSNQVTYPLNPERNLEMQKIGKLWTDCPPRELGPHDGRPKAIK